MPTAASAAAQSPPASGRETNRWLVLVLVCFAQFMVVLDATIVNVALPSIQRDLGLTTSGLGWVINAYTLVLAGSCSWAGGRRTSSGASGSSWPG